MNNINMLKEIGLKEVARKTHIELKYLEAIMEKDFQALCRKNVKGYVKILSREYDIDFESWMKEYEEYSLANTQDISQIPFVSPKIPAYRQKDKSNSASLMIFIVILVVFLAWFFDAAKYLSMIPNMLNDENRSVVYSDSKVVEDVEKNIIDGNNTKNIIEVNASLVDENLTIFDENSTTLVNLDENISLNSIENSIKKDENISNLDKNSSFSSMISSKMQKVIIKPKTSIWIGTINLDNGAKKTITTNKDYEVDMSKSQLILTGHGNFSIDIDGENRPSGTSVSTRFLVKDGEFKSISADEFMSMNKGKAW